MMNDQPDFYGDQERPGPAAQTNAAPPSQGYGHPIYDQIGQLFKQHTGRDATQQEVGQWGTNIDSAYLQKIGDSIANTDEARAYKTKQNAPPPQPGAQTQQQQLAKPSGTGVASSPVRANGTIPPPSGAPLPPRPNIYSTPPPAEATYHAPQTLIDQSGQTSAQNALLMALLQHPESMSAQGVNQLKEAQKESALSMQSQNLQAIGQGSASRGTYGGGTQEAHEGLAREASQKNIMDSYRNIDIQKMMQDQQDKLNALSMSDGILSGQVNRAMAPEQLRQAGAESAFNNWNAAQEARMKEGLTREGYDLDWANLGERGRQFDSRLNFDYAGLDQSSQEALMRILFGGG